MNIYWVIHYFVEGGQHGNFHWDSELNYKGGKNDFRKMAA